MPGKNLGGLVEEGDRRVDRVDKLEMVWDAT